MPDPTAPARRLGRAAAGALVALQVAYAGVLAIGLATLPAPGAPIADPWFTAMELLILAIAPALVALMAALHARAAPARRVFGVLAVAFAAALAAVTLSVHFAVLTLSRAPEGAGWAPALAFRWPSPVYALDVMAWDLLFPLAALSAALALAPSGRARAPRRLLMLAAALSAFGLLGAATGEMALRNLGILGYAVAFPVAAALLRPVFAAPPEGDA